MNVVIGDFGQDYTIDEWNNVFASIKVNVSGDFADKMLAHQVKNSSEFLRNMLRVITRLIHVKP